MIINKSEYLKCIDVLNNDGIMAYPTDTVYGLGVRFGYENARLNLMDRKKRPEEKSFPVMVSDLRMMESIALVSNQARKIVQAFMPGPLTVVLKKKDGIYGDRGTLAIRLAHDETIKKIIDGIGCPIYLTSANLSNNPVCKSAIEIERLALADIIVDGDILGGEASTIVDLSGDEPKILREGPVSLEELLRI